MDPQPNFQRLADSLVGISEGLLRLPNVPVITEGQNILNAINTMQAQMDTQFERLGVSTNSHEIISLDTNSFKARIDGLEQRFDGLQGQFNGLQLQQNVE